ncbi:BnaAnng14130D [Brassica napus]|uniref:BnaAnng14130D protein n=1 Tax=Brassica napus TaxID=3708 RepID=A0A078J261_BRANA|nr:BnaAnng14130D [Brassica napus]
MAEAPYMTAKTMPFTPPELRLTMSQPESKKRVIRRF